MQKLCGFLLFRLLGWRMVGTVPKERRYLLVAIPHTSNWDFIVGWLAITGLGLNVKIFAKDIFYTWPLNYICDLLGVLPVNRRVSTNFVDSVAEKFESIDDLKTLITPEGTRGFQPKLKSGYYYLAKKAGVPIVVAGPNYSEKTFTILPARAPLENFEKDQANIIEFCKTQHGKHPDQTFQ